MIIAKLMALLPPARSFRSALSPEQGCLSRRDYDDERRSGGED
jgi:hypothetical protein